MHVKLVIRSGTAVGRVLELVPGKVGLVGRASWAELTVPDDIGVSGRHFALECHPRHCRLRDLQSTNGTFVNGERVAEAFLKHGDEILAGQTRFEITIVEVTAAPSASDDDPPLSVPKTRRNPGSAPKLANPLASPPLPANAGACVIIEVIAGPSVGRRHVLSAGGVALIGRASWAEVCVSGDADLSGRHLSILFQDNECRLRDLQSTNGTRVNGADVREAVLKHGDQIEAGRSAFRVTWGNAAAIPTSTAMDIALPPETPSVRVPARTRAIPAAAAPSTPHENLVRMLSEAPDPLFALLDGARDPGVLPMLQASGLEFKNLYEGPPSETLARWAPQLVRLPVGTPFLDTLVRAGWGRSWGFFLTAKLSLTEVRHHFRHFLLTKLPDGREAYFRFYDPRVLRVFLPSCDPEQAREFFGPIGRFLLEGHDAGVLMRFSHSSKGVREELVPVWAATAPVGAGAR